jgi:hypothetical protein
MKKLGAILLMVGASLVWTPPAMADHERERCYGDECYEQDYDQWNNEDRNRNRNRNRGAFSPGPFDDSPVDAFNGNVICLPGSTCYQDDRQREGEQDAPR